MDNPIEKILRLDDLVHDRTRLAILTILSKCSSADLSTLAEITGLPVGDLAPHVTHLEHADLVKSEKRVLEIQPYTRAIITRTGRTTLQSYLASLTQLQNDIEHWLPPQATSTCRPLEKTLVRLSDDNAQAYDAYIITRADAERIISQQDVGALVHIAYNETWPNIVANVIGQAALNLQTGEIWPSARLEDDEAEPVQDALLILYECNTTHGPSAGWDYTKLHVLTEDEATELEDDLRFQRSLGPNEPFDLHWQVGTDAVPRYLERKGDSIERREKEALEQAAREEVWPNWTDLSSTLDAIYGPEA